VKRVNDLHVLLGVSRAGDVQLDSDAHVGKRRRVDVVDEPIEGIPAIRSIDGIPIPLLRCYVEGDGLEDLVRLGQQVATQEQLRLEVVRFTFRHHVGWIEPVSGGG
jgi:hypothetical protein